MIDGVGRGSEIEPRSPIVEEEEGEALGKQLEFNRMIEQQGHRTVLGTYTKWNAQAWNFRLLVLSWPQARNENDAALGRDSCQRNEEKE